MTEKKEKLYYRCNHRLGFCNGSCQLPEAEQTKLLDLIGGDNND